MINPRELISLVDAVSKEKNLSRQEITSYLQYAMETSLRKNFPEDAKIKITIDSVSGEIVGHRLFNLVDSIENIEFEMLKNEVEDELVINGIAHEPFHVELNRQQINITKQVVLQKINLESRNKQFRQLLEREHNIFTGVVKVIKKDQIIADYHGIDIVLNKSHLLPRDTYRAGVQGFKISDKITFSLVEEKGFFFGSRTTPQLLIELLKEEVPALNNGNLEIIACSRIPGYRSRIIVKSNDPKINPVSTVVGSRGANTNSVKNQLGGENITVIPFNTNVADMFVHAINPVQILGIMVDENTKTMEVSVKNEDLQIAAGKDGNNIASISELLGWKIDLYSSDEWHAHNNQTHGNLLKHIMLGLSCDQELAEIVIEAGIDSIDYFKVMTRSSLEEALELDEETLNALISNAMLTMENPTDLKLVNAYLELGKFSFSSQDIDVLVENSIFNIHDLADLSAPEILDFLPNFDKSIADRIILNARQACEPALVQ